MDHEHRCRDSLLVVMTARPGSNRRDDALAPAEVDETTSCRRRPAGDRRARFAFLGDTSMQFVFDRAGDLVEATRGDLATLEVDSIGEAVDLAMSNVKRIYGMPELEYLDWGAHSIECSRLELSSSFMLDRDYWSNIAGLPADEFVAAFPDQETVIFAPTSSGAVVDLLRSRVADDYRHAHAAKVSSALFRYARRSWSVFQAPVADAARGTE